MLDTHFDKNGGQLSMSRFTTRACRNNDELAVEQVRVSGFR